MASETSIANRALRMLGATRIVDRTDGSKSGNVVGDIFDIVRDDMLRIHPWNFAMKRQKLAQSAVAPAFGFDYAYPLPSDWLRTVSVHNNDGGVGTTHYRAEVVNGQMSILSDDIAIYLRFVYRITDVNLMTADFQNALATQLASDMAIALTDSARLQATLEARATRLLARARSTDGMGASPESRPRGSWADARRGNSSTDWQLT